MKFVYKEYAKIVTESMCKKRRSFCSNSISSTGEQQKRELKWPDLGCSVQILPDLVTKLQNLVTLSSTHDWRWTYLLNKDSMTVYAYFFRSFSPILWIWSAVCSSYWDLWRWGLWWNRGWSINKSLPCSSWRPVI